VIGSCKGCSRNQHPRRHRDNREEGSNFRSLLKAKTGRVQYSYRFLQSSALALGIRVCGAVISYSTQVFIARFLGTFDFGLYSFAWSCAFLTLHPSDDGT
jgi:hypothetical protein